MTRTRRGAIQMVDAILTFFVLVSIIALGPYFMQFSGMLRSYADPFSALLLSLFVPFLLIALIYSIGVSAKRGG